MPWRERERASHWVSEASSLCDRPTERPRRAPSASEREREEREGEKQERPCAALPVKLTRWWQARPPLVKLTDLLPFQSS
jgi:hypothetical protein